MKKIYRNLFSSILLSFFLFLCPYVVSAQTTASASFSGNGSVYVGNTIDITLVVSESGSSSSEGVAGIQGPISFDSSKLELVSTKSLDLNVNYNNAKIIGMVSDASQYLRGTKNVMTFTFRAKSVGSTTISIKADISDAAGTKIFSNTVSKTIHITEPPSSNNNLSNLSVSVGNINFNKNTTSYRLTVDSSVTTVTINANTEDSGAKIYGTGNKSLNYGDNTFDIVVTAPSGAQKTYTVTINRQDNRSSNANLSSLKVNGGELTPNFNKNTTKYSLSVPYSVSSLTVDAKAEDAKAKVSVSGNNGLVAEETKDVTITVTAENGSKKTYTISVSRGKDPNKKLSNNNYLSHLNVSIGILSPVFDKENTNYEVWLPYEVDKINFDYGVEDTKYATIKFDGNDTLQPGVSNIYKIIVTAENEEERTYTISVKRAKNPSETGTGNTYLKSIQLKNGTLLGSFDKETYEYFYTKSKGFEIAEIIPEDENSAISIAENGNTIYIIVTSSSGEYGVYTFREKEFRITNYLWFLLIFILGIVTGFLLTSFLKKKKCKQKERLTKERKAKTRKHKHGKNAAKKEINE